MKLRRLTSSLRRLPSALAIAPTPSEQRITGRRRKDRRERMWARNPHCASCGRLTDLPHGFELDHIVRLDEGGQDVEANCQILCVHWSEDGGKLGCHAEKTAEEERARRSMP